MKHTDTSAAGAPARPDLLDPAVIRTMPPKVAAFMLYEPPSLSAWRPQETASQREEREFFEELARGADTADGGGGGGWLTGRAGIACATGARVGWTTRALCCGVAGCLRRHPELFGRPEIQLNLIQQNNTVENSMTINITGTEAAAIELQAQPVRERVSEMIRQYRPVSGNGDAGVRDIEASPVPEPVREPPPIGHRGDSDAQNPGFWHALVGSAHERKVARQTAEFVLRTLLVQVAGYKGHRVQIDFDHDPVTIEELFARLEKLCGGAAG